MSAANKSLMNPLTSVVPHVLYIAVVLVVAAYIDPDFKQSDRFNNIDIDAFTYRLVLLVGVVYPTIAAFRAVGTDTADDDRVWVTYFVVFHPFFALYEMAEYIAWWLPLWELLHFAVTLWLLLPWTNGAGVVFEYVLKPLVARFVSPELSAKVKGSVKHATLNIMSLGAFAFAVPVTFMFIPEPIMHVGCLVSGIVYPGLMSFRALATQNNDRICSWLTYWMAFSLFTIANGVVEDMLFWMPFWNHLEFIVTIYLWFPGVKGAEVIYHRMLKAVDTKKVE